jgi:hypothetical protein
MFPKFYFGFTARAAITGLTGRNREHFPRSTSPGDGFLSLPHDGTAGNEQSRPDAQVASVRWYGLQSYQEARDENDHDRDS